MFILDWERVFTILSAERLLTGIFTGLEHAWFEHFQLLLFGFHINSEIDKSVQSNIIGFKSLNLPIAHRVFIAATTQ